MVQERSFSDMKPVLSRLGRRPLEESRDQTLHVGIEQLSDSLKATATH